MNTLMGSYKSSFIEKGKVRARSAKYHTVYQHLGAPGYVKEKTLSHFIVKNICRARCEMLNLNFKPWISGQVFTCSLCNSGEDETMLHFLARCHVLRGIRRVQFGALYLTNDDAIEYLNGKNWSALGWFIVKAERYRNALVEEFNF